MAYEVSSGIAMQPDHYKVDFDTYIDQITAR